MQDKKAALRASRRARKTPPVQVDAENLGSAESSSRLRFLKEKTRAGITERVQLVARDSEGETVIREDCSGLMINPPDFERTVDPIVRWAEEVLAEHGGYSHNELDDDPLNALSPPPDQLLFGSLEWYAWRLLQRIEVLKRFLSSATETIYKAGLNVDLSLFYVNRSLSWAVELGAFWREALFKSEWEADALSGRKVASGGRIRALRSAPARLERDEMLVRRARALGPGLSIHARAKRIERLLGFNFETVRKILSKKLR